MKTEIVSDSRRYAEGIQTSIYQYSGLPTKKTPRYMTNVITYIF